MGPDLAGGFFTKPNRALARRALEEPLEPADLLDALAGQPLVRTGGLRCFYVDATVAQGVCYVDGERYAFGPACHQAVLALCDEESLTPALLGAGLRSPEFVSALAQWVNGGYWYFVD